MAFELSTLPVRVLVLALLHRWGCVSTQNVRRNGKQGRSRNSSCVCLRHVRLLCANVHAVIAMHGAH